ncbi:MAG: hypothetical protein COT34_02090 [Candidatus Nealsonbacteria bacterium CG08_land_8_20_14_0_20_43_11]|uniref:RNHCP domain-containing protein n=1 Tax=Candidatus Nealsonbacteria bacterium CG08_land_8_20_14_0_20_43_11 TaxID=1974706 RepID=A0A2M6T0B0_9BACT|nr:MAG: hypothetical protein COT34_02090 [Candidatus Nealsonbacteria bacterium CG08_land_8_20_14_0_20_43_11]
MRKSGFQKRLEDFTCEHCGDKVKGTGYTDHCSQCLWSKHTDIMPGDRQNKCQGIMKPVAVLARDRSYVIYYQCQRCGAEHRVKAAANDNSDEILKLISKPIPF